MEQDKPAYLLDIVEVAKEKRIRCQADGCGHPVYARVHVVLVDGLFQVLGGDCFQRLYGRSLLGATSFYGGSVGLPTRLDDEMRLLLETNTAEFIERLEARRKELETKAARSGQVTSASAQPTIGSPTIPKAGRRFVFPVNDPSTAPYEGSEMLKWKWVQDREYAAASLSEAKVTYEPHAEMIVRYYSGFDLNYSPYHFALTVELEQFLPKCVILRTLHELGLVEQD
ncbi:hypothetical protein [Massilia sp.]|uniref:hypothetical protein n=1 Tax=Massilia sp. TaxID=1882437 RepID=UPI00352D0B96